MKVEITYCAPCGYLSRAVALAGKVLEARDDDIESLALIPSDMGVFDVAVGDRVVFSKDRTGRFPEPDEVTRHIPQIGLRTLADGAACPLPE